MLDIFIISDILIIGGDDYAKRNSKNWKKRDSCYPR